MTPTAYRVMQSIIAAIDADEEAPVADCLYAVAAELGVLAAFAESDGANADDIAEVINKALEEGRALFACASAEAEPDPNAN